MAVQEFVFNADLTTYTIASYLSYGDLPVFAQVKQETMKAAKSTLLLDHVPSIKLFNKDTFLGKIASKQPSITSEAGCIELVHKVRHTANEYVLSNQGFFLPEDRNTLKIPEDVAITTRHLFNLSYNELDKYGTVIQDRLLLNCATAIFPISVGLHEELADQKSLVDKAMALRKWCENMPAMTPRILGQSLLTAASKGNLEIVIALLKSPHAIAEEFVTQAFEVAAMSNKLEIVSAILESNRPVSSGAVECVFHSAVIKNNLQMVNTIIDSECPFRREWVALLLGFAVENGSGEIVNALLQSKHDIDSEEIEFSLIRALKIGSNKVSDVILQSKRVSVIQDKMAFAHVAVETGNFFHFWRVSSQLSGCKKLLLAIPLLTGAMAATLNKMELVMSKVFCCSSSKN